MLGATTAAPEAPVRNIARLLGTVTVAHGAHRVWHNNLAGTMAQVNQGVREVGWGRGIRQTAADAAQAGNTVTCVWGGKRVRRG